MRKIGDVSPVYSVLDLAQSEALLRYGHQVSNVIEDYGSSNLTTNYFYDLLGDLTNVMKCWAGWWKLGGVSPVYWI